MSAGRLVICPTPIGNPGDITIRALELLGSADAIACEDTRRTGMLLARHGIESTLIAVHDHNERPVARKLAARIARGETVALVSDAGMPVVSDPGFALIATCLDEGLAVEVLPGASAVTAALVASGMPADRFAFEGFLPRRSGELARLLEDGSRTIVAFESPRRLAASLEVLAQVDGQRKVAVCRELTKTHEEVVRGSATELAARFGERPAKGEVTVVIAPADDRGADPVGGIEQVRELVAAGAKPRAAAKAVAALTGGSANALYEALKPVAPGDGGGD